MPTTIRACGLILTIVLVALGSSTAAAVSFSIEGSPRSISAPSSGKVTFSAAGFITIECNFTLGGSLQGGLVEKTVGTQFGQITEVRIAGCIGGRLNRVLTPLPIRYRGIGGTLPTRVNRIDFAILLGIEFENGSFPCLYRGELLFATFVTGTDPYTLGNDFITTGDNIGGGSGPCALLNGEMIATFSRLEPVVRIRRV